MTNGTLRLEEAVAKKASVLITHMKLFQIMDGVIFNNVEEESEPPTTEPDNEVAMTLDKNLSKLIEELELSVCSSNCLKRAGIHIVGDLADKTEEEMMKVRNLDHKSLEEIKHTMDQLVVTFKQSPNAGNLTLLDE